MSTYLRRLTWRLTALLCYPLFRLYGYLRYRKRIHALSCLVNEIAKESDRTARALIAKKILELLYRDWNQIETAGTFDDAAIVYLMTAAPWLALRWNATDRVVWLATYQGDLTLKEQWEFLYVPVAGLTDEALHLMQERHRNQARLIDLLHQENKLTTALLIYFIMLSLYSRR